MIRRTVVCRNTVGQNARREPQMCGAGGWWGDKAPTRCPRCGGALTELAPTYVTPL